MKKFVSVESLRGWMAWWVVLGHAIHVSGTNSVFSHYPFKLLLAGGLAVNVFMVISGFVITHLLLQQRETYGQYLFRRGWRLLPMMMAMVLLCMAITPLYHAAYVDNPWSYESGMRAERLAGESQHFTAHLLAHLSMLHGVLPDQVLKYASTTFLAPAWSISLEWQFYVVAPLLIVLLTKRSLAVLGGTLAMLAISAISLSGIIFTWQMESFLPLMLPFFLLGMTLRLSFSSIRQREPMPAQALLVTAASWLIYCAMSLHDIPLLIIQIGVVAGVCGLFFLIAAEEMEVVAIRSKLLDRLAWLIALNPLAIGIGKVSYSTYLVHIPVFSIVIGTAVRLNPNLDHQAAIGWTAVAVALTLPASFLCYRYIEVPTIELGRRLVKSKPKALIRA